MFSKPNSETACGMFTLPHIISLIFCLLLIALAVYLSRKFDEGKIKKTTKIMAYVFTIWEICKIAFKLSIGEFYFFDHWIPLYYCSLFIVALWLCAYGKGYAYKLGEAFILGGCILGGVAFLVVPTTSLMDYPVYHFLSIHSMLFHSSMVYMGILYIFKHQTHLGKDTYLKYAAFVGGVCVFAIILNLITGENFMIVSSPVNIPVKIINSLSEACPWLYTVCVTVLYVTLPFGISKCIKALINKITNTRMR